MKKLITSFLSLAAALTITVQAQSLSSNTGWHWRGNTIVTDTPVRPEGQKDVINLATPKLEVVRVGFAGLGMRGPGAVERFSYIPGTQTVALCDYEKERAESCQKYLTKQGLPQADIYSGEYGYVEMCKRPDIDLIYICAD